MKYHDITHEDMKNGDGLRTVLWVAGCSHHCEGCQNPMTWDPDDGIPFNDNALEEIFRYCDKDYCSGLTLSGGDPMYMGNRDEVTKICMKFRERYGNSKTIWMYTGYKFDDIKDTPILLLVDVIIDGRYISSLRNLTRQWVGSENQIVWRKCKNGEWYPEEARYGVEREPERPQGCGECDM